MHQQIRWQPISMLPLVASMIEDIHRSTLQQQANLEIAKLNPLLLAPKELARMKLAYSNQLDSLSLFQQQCERWLTEDINLSTENLLLETTERLFELNMMTQGILTQLTFLIGS